MNERHIFSPEYEAKKDALLCAVREESEKKRLTVPSNTVKAAAVCAVCALMIAGGAVMMKTGMTGMPETQTSDLSKTASNEHTDDTGMNASTNGTATFITAKMNPDPTLPKREWNFGEGEVGIKLEYGYFPEDIRENPTAPYKYGSESDESRSMAVVAYDLRRSDFSVKISESQSCETLPLGTHTAYLVTDSVIARYDRRLYVFLEEDDLVVMFWAEYGMLDSELKEIAASFTAEETLDVSEAMPIWWCASPDDTDAADILPEDDPFENTDTGVKLGEKVSGVAVDYTVDSVEIRDSVAGLDEDCTHLGLDHADLLIGEDGTFIPYERTELIRGDGVNVRSGFGESKTVRKKLVIVEYTVSQRAASSLDDVNCMDFQIAYLDKNADGAVCGRVLDTVIGHIPGGFSEHTEPVYGKWEDGVSAMIRRPVSECDGMKLKIGYLVDDDMLGDLYAVGGKLSGGFDFAVKLG